MNARTRLARAVYRLAGLVQHIKTPQRTYRVSWDSPEETPTFEPQPREWLACRTTWRLVDLSQDIDPAHWDHWAVQHNDCSPTPCSDCGGEIYHDEDEAA